MTTAVISALIACVVFAAAGPHLARALPPATAVRLLVPAMVLAAGCGVFVLGTVAFTWLGQVTEVAAYGEWSPQSLAALDPIPRAMAVTAGALLLVAGGWWLRTAARTAAAVRATLRDCQRLEAEAVAGGRGPVVVVDSDRVAAFTTPAIAGRIVVTTGLLAALDDGQRRALLAHEHSHLRHRHPWWTLAADQAAAICPLLRPTAGAVRLATERWADEDAARLTGRRLVARTIATVALLPGSTDGRRLAPPVAAATGGQVPLRVRALLRPAPPLRARYVGALLALTAAVLVTALAVERTGELLFEHAEPATAGGFGTGHPQPGHRDRTRPPTGHPAPTRQPDTAWKART